MKLVLHIGTHKTATTTIQRGLARNRRQLDKRGIWYPRYSDVMPEIGDHYAHLDLAKALMDESKRFTPESVADFFRELYRRATTERTIDTVLLSSEPFYRGRMPGDGPFWNRRREYVSRVREIIPFDEVEVVVVVRRQDDYLESLYNEHVKTTRYGEDIWSFFKDYRSRFEYRRQIELWSEYFSTVTVCTFEHLIAGQNVTETFLECALGVARISLDDSVAEANVSLPVDLVEYKRLLNKTALDRAVLRDVAGALERVATARERDGSRGLRWLSTDERRKVLDEFADDNVWLSARVHPESQEAAFSDQVPDRPVFQGLDLGGFAATTAAVLQMRAA